MQASNFIKFLKRADQNNFEMKEMQSSVERDLGLMDGIVLPVALLIFAFMLKSLRLMILPISSVLIRFEIFFSTLNSVERFKEILQTDRGSLCADLNFSLCQ